MKEYRCEVTEEDIEKGTRRDSRSCALALALKRTLGDSPRVSLDYLTIALPDEPGKRRWFRLSPKGAQFVRGFDNGEPVKPFKFVLRVKGA